MHALALDEVSDYHIFAGNPVVDAIGVRSYLGAPLIDGTVALGTVAVIDTKTRELGSGRDRVHEVTGRRTHPQDRAPGAPGRRIRTRAGSAGVVSGDAR
ncbi:hypothetical protein [Actinomadura montaniterrae]|uniref:GAF domain-containing protein n=1 Tax=Actinomadura montaniterrae TaxID=1803903 RepID=A0A6L3W1S5_9ACTN|nr:hypothetical protein [Actinomadura montaniterrae]KAB2388853.1 hypothetical protein F9B16_02765 [Actinomadura montaniterrae]